MQLLPESSIEKQHTFWYVLSPFTSSSLSLLRTCHPKRLTRISIASRRSTYSKKWGENREIERQRKVTRCFRPSSYRNPFLVSNSHSGATGIHSPPLSLLALPSELRCMIWEAVALCSGPILVCADSFTHGPLAQVARFRYTIPAPAPPPIYKRRRFKDPRGKRNTKYTIEKAVREAALRTANPLIWLLTNRQIYTEARHIFYAKVCLGFNDPVCLASFMFETAKIFIKPSMVKSISLDLRLAIDANPRDKNIPPYSDKSDEFSFSRAVNHGWVDPLEVPPRTWFGPRQYACKCPFCLAITRSLLGNGAEHFTALRELRLQISFGCAHVPQHEIYCDPVCGHSRVYCHDGRCHWLEIQSKSANALACKDNYEQIAGFSKWLCTQVPLRIFSRVRLDAVDVQFSLGEIKSNPSFHRRGYCGLDYSGCWSDNSMVDKESIESCGIAEEIKRRLMDGDSEEEG